MSSSEELRAIALQEFAHAGYAGTSLHRVAELAGLSKSSVLYHFVSKETLLEAAIAPAIDRMDAIISSLESAPLTDARRREFVVDFVDFLLEHRLEVHMFINQGPSLEDVPIVDRANQIVLRLATYFCETVPTTEGRLRFGVALGGAAYTLVTAQTLPLEESPIDETRAALVTIVGELLAPVSVQSVSH